MNTYPEDFSAIMTQYPGIVVEAHRAGAGRIELTHFILPKNLRHHGLGTHTFKAWLKTLPKDTEMIELFAADMGQGRSDKFWDSLGFNYLYESYSESELIHAVGIEGAYTMVLGVNGHATPQSEYIDPYPI